MQWRVLRAHRLDWMVDLGLVWRLLLFLALCGWAHADMALFGLDAHCLMVGCGKVTVFIITYLAILVFSLFVLFCSMLVFTVVLHQMVAIFKLVVIIFGNRF